MIPGEGSSYPLPYSGLENPMDCIVPWGRKESDTSEPLPLLPPFQRFMYLLMTVLALGCVCMLSLVAVSGLLIVMVSFVAEHGL